MKILLLNPPRPTGRRQRWHLRPPQLAPYAGPLFDAGHEVELLDAGAGTMATDEIVRRAVAAWPGAIIVGHCGDSISHPHVAALTRALRAALPTTWIVYGGALPAKRWREILAREPQVDVILRVRGAEILPHLVDALEAGTSLWWIPGIAFVSHGTICTTRTTRPERAGRKVHIGARSTGRAAQAGRRDTRPTTRATAPEL